MGGEGSLPAHHEAICSLHHATACPWTLRTETSRLLTGQHGCAMTAWCLGCMTPYPNHPLCLPCSAQMTHQLPPRIQAVINWSYPVERKGTMLVRRVTARRPTLLGPQADFVRHSPMPVDREGPARTGGGAQAGVGRRATAAVLSPRHTLA
jgi:hypothetical protein